MPYNMGPWSEPASGTNSVPILNGAANTASAIYKGSLLGRSAGLLVALATTPTASTIVGVAQSDNNTAPGYNMANQPSTVQARANIIPYVVANVDTIFASHLVNGSDTNVTPVIGDVGVSIGLRVKADGEVAADRSLVTTDARVNVFRIITGPGLDNLVLWKFLSTAIAPA